MGALYALAIWVGRLTMPTGEAMAMVWPAAGVSLVWLTRYARRGWRGCQVALIAMVVLATGLTYLTGSPPAMAALYGAANTILAVVAAAVLVRGPGADGARLESPLRLYHLVAAAAIASIVSAPLGAGGPMLLLGAPPAILAQWILRNVISIVLVGIVAFRLASRGPRVLPKSRTRQLAAACALSLLAYGFVYVVADDGVWLFLLVPVSMFVALRCDVRTSSMHTVCVSILTIVVTVLGWGPLQEFPGATRVVIVQGVVLVLSVVAMTLVLDREERARLTATVEAHRLASMHQAELLERLVGSLRDGVLLVQDDGAVTMRNATGAAMLTRLGSSDDTVPSALFDPSYEEARPLNQVFAAHEEVRQDVSIQCVRGQDAHAVGASPDCGVLALTAHGLSMSEETQAVVVLQDVTDERRRTEELSRFAGVVAHDLRNPLGAIVSWAEVLGEELDGHPEYGQMIERISSAGARMNQLIEDLLAYSVARGGDLTTVPVDLQALVAEVADGQRDRQDTAADPLVTVDAHVWVDADPAALRQVVSNLVGNAVKYTAHGLRPKIDVTAEAIDGDQVEICVADRGIGLPPGEEARVFDEFHRVSEHAAGYAGTGLGLAICRRIVDRHGGRIWAEARPGGGTSFRFTLPVYEPSGEAGDGDVDAADSAPHAEESATRQGQAAWSASAAVERDATRRSLSQ